MMTFTRKGLTTYTKLMQHIHVAQVIYPLQVLRCFPSLAALHAPLTVINTIAQAHSSKSFASDKHQALAAIT